MVAAILQQHFPKKPKPRLSQRILLINLITLLIPLIGILQTNNYRQTLINRELAVLETDAHIFATALSNSVITSNTFEEERLSPEMAGEILRRFEIISGHRSRLFVPSGLLVFDTNQRNTGGNIEIEILLETSYVGWVQQILSGISEWLLSLGLSEDNLESYQEFPLQSADNYSEVLQALNGTASHMVRKRDDGHLVLTAAVPVQLYRRVLGALMLSQDDRAISLAIQQFHLDIFLVFLASLMVTVILSVFLSRTIARPLYRLANAAEEIEQKYAPSETLLLPSTIPINKIPITRSLSQRRDEIGHLAHSLNRMTRALQHRIESMEHFGADIAHELRNPITSMRSALENIGRSALSEPDRAMANILQQDISRLDRLIYDIAESCRIEAEFAKNMPERIDLTDLLKTFVVLHTPLNSQIFVTQFSENPVFILGYRDRLGQVLENLVNNAKSFSPPHGRIFLKTNREKTIAKFSIGDEGPGIAPENFEKIFERFFSLRPKQEKFGHHSGLGLSICRQIIEALGGKIYAGNRFNSDGSVAGAIFTVELPHLSVG